MPTIPEWLPRLPEIIVVFETLSTPTVHRPVFETVFRVSRRRAIQLMHELGERFDGKPEPARMVGANRQRVLARLHSMQAAHEMEEQRKARLEADLEEARRLAPGRKIRIDTAPDVRDRTMAELPAAIQLRPGELRIDFFGTEDLLRHLFELSQAAANDYARFAALCEEPAKNGKARGAGTARAD